MRDLKENNHRVSVTLFFGNRCLERTEEKSQHSAFLLDCYFSLPPRCRSGVMPQWGGMTPLLQRNCSVLFVAVQLVLVSEIAFFSTELLLIFRFS